MAEGALRELLVSWGVEVDEKPLHHLESHLEGIKESFERVGERIAEYFAFREMKEFILGTVEMGAHLKEMSERLGIGTQDLQKFQFAAKMGGVEADEASHALSLFARQLGEAKQNGGEAAKTLDQLHIKYKDQTGAIRPTLDILDDFADRMKDTAPAERSAYAMRLFGRTGQAMIPALTEGKEGLHKLYEEFDQLGGGLSDRFIEDAQKTQEEIDKMKLGFISLRGQLVQMMLPTLRIVVDKFMEWTKALVEISKETRVFQHIWEYAKILLIVKAFTTLIPVFRAIAAGEGLIDALNPFTWLVIGAVALFLILDDLWTMMEGGQSVIGDALGPEKAQFVQDLKDDFQILKDAAKEFFDMFASDGEKQMDTFTESVVMLGKALKYVLDLMAAVVEGGKKIGEGIGGLLFHEADKNAQGGLATGGLTPEAQKQLEDLQGSGKSKYKINAGGGDPHVDRMIEIMEEVKRRHEASASLPPATASKLMSGTDNPGYRGPTGPAVAIQKLEVNVSHTGKEDPKSLAGNIATGTRDELNKQLVNANNTVKRK